MKNDSNWEFFMRLLICRHIKHFYTPIQDDEKSLIMFHYLHRTIYFIWPWAEWLTTIARAEVIHTRFFIFSSNPQKKIPNWILAYTHIALVINGSYHTQSYHWHNIQLDVGTKSPVMCVERTILRWWHWTNCPVHRCTKFVAHIFASHFKSSYYSENIIWIHIHQQRWPFTCI